MAKRKQGGGAGVAVAIVAVIMIGGTVAITQDFKTGRNSLVEAAKAQTGDTEAQYQAGLKALSQGGVMGKNKEGLQWLEKAAKGGHVKAMLKLGDMYNAGTSEADGDAAVAWYEKASKAGNIEATRKLGIAYSIGRGRSDANPAKALPLFETAAKAGDAEAQLQLGQALIYSARSEEAVTWLTKAGEAGQARAWYLLGEMYYQEQNVKQDVKRAFGYYDKGSEGGNDEAQLVYSFMYLTGRGTATDKAEAYKWVLIADEAKTSKSRSARLYIEPKLSADEKAEGKKRADAWKVANPTKVPKPAK